jgi:predicted transcriptional regulator
VALLTPREEQALTALWQCPLNATVEQVRVRLACPLPYTTLASSLQQLVHKSHVARQKHHYWHWFTPCLSAQTYGQQLARLVTAYF